MFDYVEFVAEYAPFTLHDLDNMARTAELHGMSLMIKVDDEHHGYVAQRAIGSGFDSVLFTDCRSVEDVRFCIRTVRPDTPKDNGRYGVAVRRFASEVLEAAQKVFTTAIDMGVPPRAEIISADGARRYARPLSSPSAK